MAGSPELKVYNPSGEYVAAFKYAEDAAVLVAALGEGTQIRDGHTKRCLVWDEGKEEQSAAESYDFVAQTVYARRSARWAKMREAYTR